MSRSPLSPSAHEHRTVVRLFLVAVLPLAAACAQADGGAIVPIEVARGDGASQVLVPVVIGDSEPLLFVLDTGSAESVVDVETATELGLRQIPGSDREISGAGGRGRAFEVAVEDWRLGEVPLEPGRLVAFPIPAPEGEVRPDGLLGSNVLDDFGRVTIDYDREELVLGD